MASLKYLHSSVAFLLCSCILNIATAKYVIRLRSDSDCPTPGYFRDETDCRKFYRCAEHPTGVPGQNYISRSEFNCPPGTIFDEALSSCNHIMFVQNIPPGCDVSEAVPTSTPSPAVTMETTSSPSSTYPPSSTPSTTLSSASPQLPPENLQNVPMLPGDDPQSQPMLPAINIPMIPDGGNQQQQPMFPSITFPMLPGSQGQQPMIPSLPVGGQEQQPMFPSINFPMLPGSQGQQPMIPSVPPGGQQQQSLMPFMPQFNLPSVAGSPQLPQLTLPSNMRIFGMLPSAQHTQQQQNKNQEKNLQNLYPSITIAAQNSENKPISSMPGWVTPQRFPDQSQVVKPQDISSSGGWVVPDNFPTFYSAFTGSPFLLSSNAFNNPYSLIMV